MSITTATLPPGPTEAPVPPVRRRSGLAQFLPRRSPKLIVGVSLTLAIIVFAVVVPFLTQDPHQVGNIGLRPPSSAHLLGTTQTGQDVLAQLAWGARGSLLVGLVAGVLATILSGFFGIVGAYWGGIADNLFLLAINVMLVIPGLPLVIVIATYLRGGGLGVIAVVLAFTSWAGAARVLRGQVLSIRNRDYVLAARVSGERTWRIILVEILPNLLPVMAGGFVFGVIFAVLGEAGLSFLGLGAAGTVTWGSMIYYAQNDYAVQLGAWWWFLPPGVMIALLGAGLSFINFSIDEVINPRLRSLPSGRRARNRSTR